MDFGTLVLSRKAGESIHVGDNIIIQVQMCSKGKVRLAINAPKDIRIMRSELLNRAEATTAPVPAASPAGEQG